jgi:predicted Fe-Mo cluster-binding NifX family protein
MKRKGLVTIAFPSFGTRISPRFDCAQTILVVKVKAGEIVERRDLSTKNWSPLEKVRELARLGVEMIVCGGIDRLTLNYCRKNSFKVYAWLAGEMEEILADMLRKRNSLSAPSTTRGGHRKGRQHGKVKQHDKEILPCSSSRYVLSRDP